METEWIWKWALVMAVLALVFEFGVLSSDYLTGSSISTEIPSGVLHYNTNNIPADRISQNNIEVYNDRIVIYIRNTSLSDYASTKSMIPVIDSGANGIRIVPTNDNDIQVGDIVTYESFNNLIVHRVVEIGNDSEGKYFIVKGDNNLISDGKIRFSQIKYVTVAIIY
jgi:small nuclear ribonucleoprotein (snRNP)-like protein